MIEADGTQHRAPLLARRATSAVPSTPSWSARDWEDAVEEALRVAVRRRLVADIPVGVLLSGGLDSSLIVGLLAAGGADRAGHVLDRLRVGRPAGRATSSRYSDVIAERFGTDHHRIRVGSDELAGALGHAIGAMAEPMVSHDVVAFDLLSERVSQTIRVVQSGQGADEVFAGYHWYPPLAGLDRDAAVDDLRGARSSTATTPTMAAGRLRPVRAGRGPEPRVRPRAHVARRAPRRPWTPALRLDSEVMLVDDPVKRVDNMSMAWGLEARVPFLDHDLVELAAAVPAGAEAGRGRQGRAQGGSAGGSSRRRSSTARRATSRCRRSPTSRARCSTWCATRSPRDGGRDRGLFRPEYVAGAAGRPERRAHPAAGQQALAARACSSCGCRRTRPDVAPGHPRVAGHRRRTAVPATPALTSRSWKQPSEHQLRGMGADVVLDLGWGRLVFGQTFARPARHRRRAARGGDRPPRHLHLPARPARARRAGARRAVHRPVATPTGSTCTGTGRGAELIRGRLRPHGDLARPRWTAINEHLRAQRHGRRRRRRRCGRNHRTRAFTYLVAEDRRTGKIVGTVTGVDHALAFGDPEARHQPVVPGRARPGRAAGHRARRWSGCSPSGTSARGRAYLDLSVMHDNARRDRALPQARVHPRRRRLRQAQEPDQHARCSPPGRPGLEELNPYARIIAEEALRRGIRVEVDRRRERGAAAVGRRPDRGHAASRCRSSPPPSRMSRCDDKRVTRRIMERAGRPRRPRARSPARATWRRRRRCCASAARSWSSRRAASRAAASRSG